MQDLQFKRDVDQAVDDFRSTVVRSLVHTFGAQLNAMKATMSETLGQLWFVAAVRHLEEHKPRAYRRTGGLATPTVVDFEPDYVWAQSPDSIEVRAEIVLDTAEVLEVHLNNQVTLRDVDADGSKAKAIQHTYKLYPNAAGVRGSIQPQTHEYFLAYMFAGPNAPKQPIVYRALGQPHGVSTTREKGRGLDLINKFLSEIGARPVNKLQNKMELSLNTRSPILDVMITDFEAAVRQSLSLGLNLEVKSLSAAAATTSSSQLTAKEMALKSLLAKLQPFLNK